MKTSAKPSLAETAYRRIKADILLCRLPPGQTITGYQLAPELGMSRTPVHEALKTLCQEGLLQVVPRVGYIVTTLSVADLQEIFQLRFTLESLAAGLAADRYTPADRPKFEDWRRKAAEVLASFTVGDPDRAEALIRVNRDFHVLVARISGNRRLARMVGSLLDESQRAYFLQFQPAADAGRPHDDVFAAIASGDAEAARQAMGNHVRETQRLTLEAMSHLTA